jgi:hypothetical protein
VAAPAANAPAAKPNARPGPIPRASAGGALIVVAPTAATVARIAKVFFMRFSPPLKSSRANASFFQWLRGTSEPAQSVSDRQDKPEDNGADQARDEDGTAGRRPQNDFASSCLFGWI